ncbi:phage tail tape measure protein [Actinoplanes oblitus]|uniref:Phage tail tape measure protein n=1 Tax=Actinoplanes oblitus TaxID=3040509 RepID=A0ABY8WMF8_9ACTN|nr:phage tail tape measure protein [Actinoplanes oblitus]WIM97708.1 phage tail tape measure protein [Actinoplanes oblitus]
MSSDTSLVFNILAKDKASKTFDKIKGAAAVAGVAIGAALTAGVAQMLEQSKTSALLEAQLGAGTPAAAQAGKAAGDVYASGVVGSIEEANAAVKAALQNALVPPDASSAQIDAVASKITNLGAEMEEDAGRVSAAVSQMIRTGLVQSAEEGFDLLQKGVEGGVNKSQDLLDTFNEYGTQFRALGISGPQAMGLLSQSLKAGARDSDVAADALKEFVLIGASGSAKAAAGFKALGLDAKQMTSDIAKGGPTASAALGTVLDKLRAMPPSAQKTAAATALFGTKSEDLQAALNGMDLSKASTEMGNVAGAADRAGNALEESAGAKLDAFKRRAQGALIDVLAQAVPYVEATFGWLSRNSSWVVPLATGLGILAGVIYAITTAMKVWTAVQTVLNLALWTSPITWIVLAIIALVAIVVLLATKTRFFQTIWAGVWGFLKAVGAWFAGPFAGFFVSTWQKITSAASTAWTWIRTKIAGFVSWVGAIPGRISSLFSNGWNAIRNKAASAFDSVRNKVTSWYNWIVGIPGRVSAKLRSTFDGLASSARSAFNSVAGFWNRTVGSLGFQAPSWVPGMGGKGWSVPDIPYLANGGTITGAGLAMVGERGPELLSLNRGAQVTPLNRAGAGGGRFVLEIDVTGQDAEMVRWLRKLMRTANLLQTA